MAFTQSTFAPVASNSTDTPAFWSYKTDDLFNDLLTPGYFEQKKNQLEENDFIWVICSDARRVIRYVSNDEAPEIISPKPPFLVLDSFSNSIQSPTAVDAPLQLEFGPQQGGNEDPVKIDSLGVTTINEAGFYDAQVFINATRLQSNGGLAELKFAIFKNGAQFGNTLTAYINNKQTNIPLQLEIFGNFLAGDEFYAEIARDSAGVDDGSVVPLANNLGWNDTPSASVKVFKLV